MLESMLRIGIRIILGSWIRTRKNYAEGPGINKILLKNLQNQELSKNKCCARKNAASFVYIYIYYP